MTREPEQVKAFRDTWKDGIHSYLTYLRDRLTVAKKLLKINGSIFVQISNENVHRVRAVMDEVFGGQNFVSQIVLKTTSGAGSPSGGTVTLAAVHDNILWYALDKPAVKYRQLYYDKSDMQTAYLYNRLIAEDGSERSATEGELAGKIKLPQGSYLFRPDNLTSQSSPESATFGVPFRDLLVRPGKGGWKTNAGGMERLMKSTRLYLTSNRNLQFQRRLTDFDVAPINDVWTDVGTGSFTSEKIYVVQTNAKIIQRCLLMASDPGDLILDPTSGSGTTAAVCEKFGRRWITIDTSRVAIALTRTRVMTTRYPYYLLADSPEGQAKEQALSGRVECGMLTHLDVRLGFVYDRAAHITLKSIANNAEIDVLWGQAQMKLEPRRLSLNKAVGQNWQEWQIPRDPGADWPLEAKQAHGAWWEGRIERQRQIDASNLRSGDIEYLYDRPHEDQSRVRVAGPFTVESLSPHRIVPVDEDELLDLPNAPVQRRKENAPPFDFAHIVLEHLRSAGVHQVSKSDSVHLTSLEIWPGNYIGAVGCFMEGETERRAGILIGPEFGTLSRADLVTAAREASEARFEVLIACAFGFDAQASELTRLGPINILKARMNPDLHMADDLKNTGKGNLFVVFGEPDLVVEQAPGQPDHVQIRILGVDVFDPQTGDIRSGDTSSIATWFIDTDYNEESFFVRHAYFLGANDPYKSLKAALRAEIDEEAWATLYRDVSRPFRRPQSGRIAVKVINHFGDEVMKVFTV